MNRQHKSHLLADLLESGDCPPEVTQSAATELRRLHGLLVGSNRSVFKRTLEIRRLQDKLYRGLTDDCIVQLARQAGEYQEDRVMTPHALYRFKVLVAAAERKQCALAAWEIVQYEVHADLADKVAQAILERSQASATRMCPSTYYECQLGCGDGGCKDFEDAHQRSKE